MLMCQRERERERELTIGNVVKFVFSVFGISVFQTNIYFLQNANPKKDSVLRQVAMILSPVI